MVVTRFICEKAVHSADRKVVTVQLRAATKFEAPLFWKETPAGTIELTITNPDAFVFVEGREYQVTFDATGGEV